jgi:hypothetical protein
MGLLLSLPVDLKNKNSEDGGAGKHSSLLGHDAV